MELPRASGGKPFCARQRGYRTPPCGSRLPPRRAPAPRLPAEVPSAALERGLRGHALAQGGGNLSRDRAVTGIGKATDLGRELGRDVCGEALDARVRVSFKAVMPRLSASAVLLVTDASSGPDTPPTLTGGSGPWRAPQAQGSVSGPFTRRLFALGSRRGARRAPGGQRGAGPSASQRPRPASTRARSGERSSVASPAPRPRAPSSSLPPESSERGSGLSRSRTESRNFQRVREGLTGEAFAVADVKERELAIQHAVAVTDNSVRIRVVKPEVGTPRAFLVPMAHLTQATMQVCCNHAERNGRTWDRTRDLPRVKRALSR